MTDVSPVKKPLTRSEVCSFNPLLCVVCHEETFKSLHQPKSDAHNNQLKHVFHTAPKSLAAIRVPCEKSRDVHAGKYKLKSVEFHAHIIYLILLWLNFLSMTCCRTQETCRLSKTGSLSINTD